MLMKNLESIPGARIAAVCDVWDDNLAKARQLAGPSAFSTKDCRAVLDRIQGIVRDVLKQKLPARLLGQPEFVSFPARDPSVS